METILGLEVPSQNEEFNHARTEAREDDQPYIDVRSRKEFEQLRSDSLWNRRGNLEREIVRLHDGQDEFCVVGHSVAAEQAVAFRVSWVAAADDGMPNWRESLVCPVTGLNNRMRAVVWFLKPILADIQSNHQHPKVYLMEQVTPFYAWAQQHLLDVEVVGSEWLGPDACRGKFSDGIRNEDIQDLTFTDGCFDVAVSQDVMEHVPNPWKGFAEISRVIKAGGHLLLSIPFYSNRDQSRVRTRLVNGKLEHLECPQYHGNPLEHKNGSLVFTDFGWDVLPRLLDCGFRDAFVRIYWSYEFGHLGQSQIMFLARK